MLQERLTVLLKLFSEVTVIVNVAACFGDTSAVNGEAESVKSGPG
jgi:hypothetical protein